MNTLLLVAHLHKTFTLHTLGEKSIKACQGVSFDVQQGAFLGLAGPSGAGKSTVLKCLYRTYLPCSGSIFYSSALFGQVDLARLDEQKMLSLRHLEIGYVSQFLRVIPRVSALDVVMEPIITKNGLSKETARKHAIHLLERLRIPHTLYDAFPATFSGGEQQRINIARAIGWKPRLLLLDEPTASLDQQSVSIVIELLEELRQQGTTMVGIFHDQQLLKSITDSVYQIPS